MATRVVFHDSELARLMSPAGGVGRASARAAGRIRDRAKENAPVDTGVLRNSITSGMTSFDGKNLVYRIGSGVHYAIYQEKGTGPIFAKHAPYLVFKIDGRLIRVKSTKGVPAVHYLLRAIEATNSTDFLG